MPKKTKTPQPELLEEVSERDQFQTPYYAVDLLVPFLSIYGRKGFRIWECAAGMKKISNRLEYWGYDVLSTDLCYTGSSKMNFLTDIMSFPFDCIVTNTPFSLKKKFYKKCLEYKVPFALLIPADYSGWIIQAIQDGAEKIIPTRRIDYITPRTLQRIWEGEAWERWGVDTCTLAEWKKAHRPDELANMLHHFPQFHYNSIYDAPADLLRKYSSSDFHSMWLTWGFNLGQTETFVELTNEMKNNI